ncbi:hypothetical protein ACJRO7_015482 [Eucalyptus globulus]|uniref:Protein TAPETUM DETERMINANT 1-like n=1 Tax=Eucalyptus globulus TaxID=34317 RepID=A0ABD3L4B5_EUCGL
MSSQRKEPREGEKKKNGAEDTMTGVKYLLAILLLSFITKGLCASSLENITVGTVRTGEIIQGKPQWSVTVINNFACAQSGIKLECAGFQSTEPVNSSIFAKQGDRCLVNGGKALAPQGSVSFSYAWYPPFLLRPAESIVIGC